MADCVSIYLAELDACDAQLVIDKAACNGDPTCLAQAYNKHSACVQSAYLRYIQCIGQQGASADQPSVWQQIKPTQQTGGAPDCGCGGD